MPEGPSSNPEAAPIKTELRSPLEPRVAMTVPELQKAADEARTQYANEPEFIITQDIERRHAMSLLNERNAGRMTDQQVAETFAARMGEVRVEADVDQLTDLYNRKGSDKRAAELLSSAWRSNSVTTAMMIDLDSFKDANEVLGHTGGDAALYAVGQHLKNGIRAGDMASRYGGDEFYLMLQAITAENAAKFVASKLVNEAPGTIAEYVQGNGYKLPKPITYSVGLAEEIPKTEDRSPIEAKAKALKIRADKASSVAKKLGKNRIVIARSVKGVDQYTDLTTNLSYTIKEDEKGEITGIIKVANG